MILATQDVASLGHEATKQLIMANTRTKLLMATDYPEEVAKLAGTDLQIEPTIQHTEGDPTGLGSARVQHTFRVDINDVRKLQAGEAIIIRQRHQAKLKIAPASKLPREKRAIARYEKKRTVKADSADSENTSPDVPEAPELDL